MPLTQQRFEKLLRDTLRIGIVLPNLSGHGTSTVTRYNFTQLRYQRGKSQLYISFDVMYGAYIEFCGKTVSSADLRNWKCWVFDSAKNGHSCHCTFFLMALREMGLVDCVSGRGVVGDPFNAKIKK